METVIHPPKTLMEVFKSLPEGTLIQLIENELVMSPAPKENQQRILGKIFNSLYTFVEGKNIGEVRCAPYDVFFDEENAFQPDIIFVAKENPGIIKEDGMHGAPDLIIEILSSGTGRYDKGKKKNVYERTGVKEYWIIDPANESAEGFFLQKDRYKELGKSTAVIQSKLLKTSFSF